MGAVAVCLVLLFAATVAASSHGVPYQIHPLRLYTGSAGAPAPGLSCLSWRVGVEANNVRGWTTVPKPCVEYVGNYMFGQQYRQDSFVVTREALLHARRLKPAGDGKDIWVFDIDETSLSNLPYYAEHGFGAEPFNSVLFNKWVSEGKAPALPESLKLYRELLSLGFKVVFLTGRLEEQRSATVSNLKQTGYHAWEKLILKGASDRGSTAVAYKSRQRMLLERAGYRIYGNIGDQWSDILGAHAGNRTFKLPDPMYYLS